MILAAFISALAAGLIVYAARHFFSSGGAIDRQKTLLNRLQGSATPRAAHQPESIQKKGLLSDIPYLSNILRRLTLANQVESAISQMNWKVPVSVFFLGSLSAGIAMMFIARGLGIFSLIPAAGVAVMPFIYVKMVYSRYIAKFAEVLPDSLSILGNAIKSGHGLESAINVVARTAPRPVSNEFLKLRYELELGVTLQQGLDNLCQRVKSNDLMIFRTAIGIQQQLGGNLVEVLDNLERTIRERYALRREIRALSSQGVATVYTLFIMPLGFLVYSYFIDKTSFMDFASSTPGKVSFSMSAIMMLCSFFMMKKIVTLKE